MSQSLIGFIQGQTLSEPKYLAVVLKKQVNIAFICIIHTVGIPTQSLGTRERSLCKKPLFDAFPKIGGIRSLQDIYICFKHTW